MRIALITLMLAVAAAGTAARALAKDYPWCAHYGSPIDSTNCGFDTRAQCMATVSGIGGDCGPNYQYVPPARATKARHRPPRHHSQERS